MKLLSSQQVHELLDYPGLIESLEVSHLGVFPDCTVNVLNEPDQGANQFVSLVGWQKEGLIAAKLVGVFPNNLSMVPSQPSVQGVVVTFDASTGQPLAVADGAAMTFRKTAADSALGAKFLAKENSASLLVVGAGGLAPHMVYAHFAANPSIRNVVIWNRTHAKAVDLAKQLQQQGFNASATDDLNYSVSQADIIACVTMSQEPLVKAKWVKPGTHIDLVGAYLPTMREADDELMINGRIFVDTRENMTGAGDLKQPVDLGLIHWEDIQADLFELCQGKRNGRNNNQEITVFKNVGGGHLDLFAAQYLQHKAG